MWLAISARTADPIGYSDPPREIVGVNLRERLIALKEPGQKYWASRGTQNYAPAQYGVYRITGLRVQNGMRSIQIDSPIMEWPIKLGGNSETAQTILDKINELFVLEVIRG